MMRMLRLAGLFLLLMGCIQNAQAFHWHEQQRNQDAQSDMAVSTLPVQALDTLHAIKRGGPFLYSRDGIVFGNFEHTLPGRPRGYYHEYTVRTPHAHNRGARRIITGASGEYYYTDNHYRTFKRIRE